MSEYLEIQRQKQELLTSWNEPLATAVSLCFGESFIILCDSCLGSEVTVSPAALC